MVGLYCFDNRVVEIAEELKPSRRGELEITDINRSYLELGQLHVHLYDTGFIWIDSGTFTSLYEASKYVKMVEEKGGCYGGMFRGDRI